MEIIPEFATPRDSLEHVFLIWNSSATLRRGLAHIDLLQLRYVAHLHGWSTYTDGPLTQGKNKPFLSAENKKRAILLRVFYFRRSKKAKIFAPTG